MSDWSDTLGGLTCLTYLKWYEVSDNLTLWGSEWSGVV